MEEAVAQMKEGLLRERESDWPAAAAAFTNAVSVEGKERKRSTDREGERKRERVCESLRVFCRALLVTFLFSSCTHYMFP